MLREKPKLFTIGQFAALHGINKKTLMWYDEIGLFKPAFIHEENGYRLYSYYQSTELEVILLLRDMNVHPGYSGIYEKQVRWEHGGPASG